jgi:hypothetical protein
MKKVEFVIGVDEAGQPLIHSFWVVVTPVKKRKQW